MKGKLFTVQGSLFNRHFDPRIRNSDLTDDQ